VRDLEQETSRWQRDANQWRDQCTQIGQRHSDAMLERLELAQQRDELESLLAQIELQRNRWQRECAALRRELIATQRALRPYRLIDQLGVVRIGYRWARRFKRNRAS
jgi:hypothetical protein